MPWSTCKEYSIVSTGGTVAACEASYRQALADNGLIGDSEAEVIPSDQAEISGAIAEIRSAVMDGNSYYFFRLEGEDVFYAVSAAENPLAVILNVGDRVTITYAAGTEASILSGTRIQWENQPEEEISLPIQEEPAEQDGASSDTGRRLRRKPRSPRHDNGLKRRGIVRCRAFFAKTCIDNA